MHARRPERSNQRQPAAVPARPARQSAARTGLQQMQRAAGNRAVVDLLGRTPPVQPPAISRYYLGRATGSTSTSALRSQVLQADGSYRDPTDATHSRTAKVGIDPTTALGGGGEPLKISEDAKMAIENVTSSRQAKVFFTTASVLKESNEKLAKIGSAYLLQVQAAGAVTVDDETGTKSRTLDAIEVVKNPSAGKKDSYKKIAPNLPGQQHGDDTDVAATCNAVARAIMGHDDIPAKSRLDALKLFTATDQSQWASALAEALASGGKRAKGPINEAQIAMDYADMLQNNPVQAAKIAKKLKINTFAAPKVGQAFSTYAVGVVPGATDKSVATWDPTTDPGTYNPKLKEADATKRSGLDRRAWGNHIGAVVASSAGNSVTFENYARDAEEGAVKDSDSVGYFAMYGPVTKPAQTWHHVWTQGPTPVPNGVTGVV